MEDLTKIEAVTFDVGGTLIEPYPSVGHVYARVAKEFGLGDLDPDKLTLAFVSGWKQKGDFQYTKACWRRLVEKAVSLPDPEVALAFFEELYQVFARKEAWRIYEDVVPTLKALRSRNILLSVLSNWDERLLQTLPELELDQYFNVTLISGLIGVHKPDRRIFEIAADKLGCSPSKILHIGDSQLEDVSGALNAGFKALRIDRSAISGKETLGDLRDLPKLLLA